VTTRSFAAAKQRVRNLTVSELEGRLLEKQLRRIERRSHYILAKLHLPTSLDQLAKRDWNPPAARRAYLRWRRGHRAMLALMYANQVRGYVEDGNAARAALAAFQAGIYGGDLLANAERGARIHRSTQQGGRAKARQQRSLLSQRDQTWLDEARRLRRNHPDLSLTAIARLVAHRVSAKSETVRKRLQKLQTKR